VVRAGPRCMTNDQSPRNWSAPRERLICGTGSQAAGSNTTLPRNLPPSPNW
jgi:hypothetical protein